MVKKVEKVEKVEKLKSGEISGQKWRNLYIRYTFLHGSHPGGGKCDRLLEKKNPLRQSQGGPGPARRAQWPLHFVHNLCLV